MNPFSHSQTCPSSKVPLKNLIRLQYSQDEPALTLQAQGSMHQGFSLPTLLCQACSYPKAFALMT